MPFENKSELKPYTSLAHPKIFGLHRAKWRAGKT
jgi:hypothetical protein